MLPGPLAKLMPSLDGDKNLVREACRQVNQGGADIARQAYLLAVSYTHLTLPTSDLV